jgi:hypothetical protein
LILEAAFLRVGVPFFLLPLSSELLCNASAVALDDEDPTELEVFFAALPISGLNLALTFSVLWYKHSMMIALIRHLRTARNIALSPFE